MNIYDALADRETLTLTEAMATEFQLATHQALEKNLPEFEFHGFIVDTDEACDIVLAIIERRTYH